MRSLVPRLLSLAAGVALAALASGCGDRAAVTGTVTYRERIALPPDAELEVVLQDISLADAPAEELSRTVLEQPGQPPFAFTLAYDPARIDPAGMYAVRARITAGGRLLFVSDQVHPVLTRGYGPAVDLVLVKAQGTLPGASAGTGAMRGMYSYLADAALLVDCRTRQRLPVAMEADHAALERAYLAARREPGEQLLVTFEGHLAERPAMEGDGTVEMVIVERFLGVWPGETCGNPGATAALEDTYWKLTRLGDAPVAVAVDQREPHLVLRSQDGRLGGSGGCNRLQGGYTLDGDALAFSQVATTMMACPDGMAQEQAFLAALARVAGWRIDGQHLELLAADGAVLLRFEERALP